MISPQLTVQCHKRIVRFETTNGSAASDDRSAYFTSEKSKRVYSYEWNTANWKELPSCPYFDSSLVFIDGELTAVGGRDKAEHYNKVLHTYKRRKAQWVVNPEYPTMNTSRSQAAVVSTSYGDNIIAIGGYTASGCCSTVELFQVKTRKWYELTDLPHPLTYPSATIICGNQVHVIGGSHKGYSCSLQALLSSDKPITPQSARRLITWTLLPSLPVTHSTAATLCGRLVIIGGRRGGTPVNSIHQLVGEQWVVIGFMTSGRERCLSVSPSPDRVLIVGGVKAEDSVEEISVYTL